ncbi:hypothetical protein MTR67_016244 [Solanum verrucosum]|uniref:Glycosyltransferase N-terminal domain-containing protein n=1 Tax=Solanum verrucosum TaxID=315347 RepID=A0AAF0QFR3_SOLVR|nr:hypothetical protein MTR67_016244 [Solanum verrucosum]
MVPFSRFTHINQLFLLSRFIAVHNIPVHLLCLPEFNKDLKPRLKGESFEIAKNIHFNDILLSQDEYKRSTEEGSAISKYSLLRQSIVVDVGNDGDDHEKLLKQMHEEFPAMDSCFPPGMEDFEQDLYEWDFNSGEFIISSREVEGKYLDLLANAKNNHECLEFLDNQDVNSVIYVSFGTGTKLSQEQLNELAFGLEKCNQRFIWVIGKGDHSNNNDNDNTVELPQGFEERVKGRGMMVRNWVPQLEILGHPSTGGFISHCGWNSCMESISMGVPIIAWPNEWDQPYNAVLVTKVLKIGISLCNWTHKDELVTSDSIEKSIKVLMDTTEGEEMRKRAVELSNKIKSSFSPGAVTTKEVESFISYITK